MKVRSTLIKEIEGDEPLLDIEMIVSPHDNPDDARGTLVLRVTLPYQEPFLPSIQRDVLRYVEDECRKVRRALEEEWKD